MAVQKVRSLGHNQKLVGCANQSTVTTLFIVCKPLYFWTISGFEKYSLSTVDPKCLWFLNARLWNVCEKTKSKIF